jgi:RimJ/RimL family protein N-acetyltransferase
MIESFETERMTAERLHARHFDELDRMHRDPRVMATLCGVRSAEQTRAFLVESLDHWDRYGHGLWVFRDRADGRYVGRAGIRHVLIEDVDEVELAYALVADAWGKGLATEMATALMRLAVEELALSRLVCFTLKTNTASRRVMEKVGFVYDRDMTHGDQPHALYRWLAPRAEPEQPAQS